MGVILSILFTIAVIAAILALCRWLILYGAVENHYPDIKDLWETSGFGWFIE